MHKESIDLHRQGRFDEAEQGYRAQLAENPDDVGVLHLLGMLRHQRGDTAEGARLLGRARELAPDDANIESSLASLAFRDGDYETAALGFERALALDPNLGGAHAGIGQIALLHGDHERAERHFRIALRTGEEPHALAGLGALLLERGDVDAALRHLGRAGDLAPHDAMVQMLLGQAFAKRDTPAFAEQAFANALRLRPDLHPARSWLGALTLRAKRYREAEAHFAALLEIPGFEASARVGLADLARAENRLEDAVALYRDALARDGDHALATRALGWSLARLGLLAEAIESYDLSIARGADDDARRERAELLELAGRPAQAADDWQSVLDRDCADLQAHSRLATLRELLDEPDLAQAHADAVLLAQPDTPDMLLLRTRSLLRDGDDAGARAVLETLGRLGLSDAQHRLCWNYLGRVHDRAGEAAAAARCFSEAQRGLSSALPALDDPHPSLLSVLAEPLDEVWTHAPILLLGMPGSGVDRVAALLADQPELLVLRDRFGALAREDDFSQPRFAHYCGDLTDDDREALRERYIAPLRASGSALDRPIVDWLPRWDAHLLALVRRAMPGTRLLIVECEPRDALLNWLAFGWTPGLACAQPDAAAEWLARARRHLHYASELDEPRRLAIAADALLDDPRRNGGELARFVGVESLRSGAAFAAMQHGLGGLPTRFAAGHWQRYRDALAEAFARLA